MRELAIETGADLAGRDRPDQPPVGQSVDVVVQPGHGDTERVGRLGDRAGLPKAADEKTSDGVGHLIEEVEVGEDHALGRLSIGNGGPSVGHGSIVGEKAAGERHAQVT